ncbi:hypothetical protein BGW80DRAFT_204489 [Lactifluus volemus]|nr:hypothetical protein BGW80DRAFT_204489 [Lactifluus volemus]
MDIFCLRLTFFYFILIPPFFSTLNSGSIIIWKSLTNHLVLSKSANFWKIKIKKKKSGRKVRRSWSIHLACRTAGTHDEQIDDFARPRVDGLREARQEESQSVIRVRAAYFSWPLPILDDFVRDVISDIARNRRSMSPRNPFPLLKRIYLTAMASQVRALASLCH